MKKMAYGFTFLAAALLCATLLGACATTAGPAPSAGQTAPPAQQVQPPARPEVRVIGFSDFWRRTIERPAIGIVENDTLRVFTVDNGWEELPGSSLQLPRGYKNVFYIPEYMLLGLDVGGVVELYMFDGRDDYGIGKLQEIRSPGFSFRIPGDYQDLIGLDGGIGVVSGNDLRLFYFSDEEWIEDDTIDLPRGYRSVFSFGGGTMIGVVINDEARFYSIEISGGNLILVEKPAMRFSLPRGYGDVIEMIDGEVLGVYVDGVVRFYIFEGYWTGFSDADFVKP